MCEYVNAALAQATWAKYKSGWHAFCEFEEATQSANRWPLSAVSVREFTTWCLAVKKLQPASVRTYLSALKLVHTLKGFSDAPGLKDKTVELILIGAKNLAIANPPQPNSRRVVTLPLLKLIGHRIAESDWADLSKQAVWTACAVAFFSSARLGELLARSETDFDPTSDLTWDQVIFTGSESALIKLRIPKSKDCEGETLDLFPFEGACCPLEAMRRLSRLQAETGMRSPTLPVFRLANGKNLTVAKLNRILSGLLRDICEKGENSISCHSFRAGIPSALARFPELASSEEVKGWGRWSSDCYKKYARLKVDRKKAIFRKISLAVSRVANS